MKDLFKHKLNPEHLLFSLLVIDFSLTITDKSNKFANAVRINGEESHIY